MKSRSSWCQKKTIWYFILTLFFSRNGEEGGATLDQPHHARKSPYSHMSWGSNTFALPCHRTRSSFLATHTTYTSLKSFIWLKGRGNPLSPGSLKTNRWHPTPSHTHTRTRDSYISILALSVIPRDALHPLAPSPITLSPSRGELLLAHSLAQVYKLSSWTQASISPLAGIELVVLFCFVSTRTYSTK